MKFFGKWIWHGGGAGCLLVPVCLYAGCLRSCALRERVLAGYEIIFEGNVCGTLVEGRLRVGCEERVRERES